MEIKVGGQYSIIDLEVPQGLLSTPPIVRLDEAVEYAGELICSGIKLRHEQHVYVHGFESIEARPIVFVVMRTERVPQNILAFTRAVRGLPLALQNGPDLVYILNWNYLMESLAYAPEKPHKAAMLGQAHQVIAWYHLWRLTGILPPFSRQQRNSLVN